MYNQNNLQQQPPRSFAADGESASTPRRLGQTWDAKTLHIALVYSNPSRWDARKRLFLECRQHLESLPQVAVHVCELAYGDRPFDVTSVGDIQLRSYHELWHKENLINLCVR